MRWSAPAALSSGECRASHDLICVHRLYPEIPTHTPSRNVDSAKCSSLLQVGRCRRRILPTRFLDFLSLTPATPLFLAYALSLARFSRISFRTFFPGAEKLRQVSPCYKKIPPTTNWRATRPFYPFPSNPDASTKVGVSQLSPRR